MAGFPFQPFSTIEVLALSDLDQSLDGFLAAIQKMMATLGPG